MWVTLKSCSVTLALPVNRSPLFPKSVSRGAEQPHATVLQPRHKPSGSSSHPTRTPEPHMTLSVAYLRA